jgi:anti-anti-sigma factor
LHLRFSLWVSGDTAVVRCAGAVVRGTETDRLAHTVHELVVKHSKCVVVVSAGSSVDAYAIGAFARLCAEAKSRGHRLTVVCNEQRLIRLFELVGLKAELDVHTTETAAFRALQTAA